MVYILYESHDGEEIYKDNLGQMLTYDEPTSKKFAEDMLKIGLSPYHYKGKYNWEGPAVNVVSTQQILDATDIECEVEPIPDGFRIHPVKRGCSTGIEHVGYIPNSY